MSNQPLRLLVIGGHPADSFDLAGGVMALHAKRGDLVTAVALTQGLRIHDVVLSETMRLGAEQRPNPEQLAALLKEREKAKYDEVVKACAFVGVTDVRFLSYDDKTLLVTSAMIEAVAKIIREVRPDIVITHYPMENGGIECHHGNTGKIVISAMEFAGTIDFDDPNPPHRTPQAFFMSPEVSTFRNTSLAGAAVAFCDIYVDITSVVEEKVRALDCMRSQQYGGNYARRVVEVVNGKDGLFLGLSYAEGFIRYYPEIADYLTVSEYRRRANEAEIETRNRVGNFIAPYVKLPD